MARQYSMPYMFPPLALLEPKADAAGRTSTNWVSLRNAQKGWLVFYVNQGNAATILVTPLQATSYTGTGSKALTNNVPIWLCDAATTADAFTTVTAAANYTTDANVAIKIVIFEITPEIALDMANGFNHIGVSTGSSNAANITSAMFIPWNSTQAATPPTTIV
jgi:hypothetical protein